MARRAAVAVTANVFGGVHDFFHSRTWDWLWKGAVVVLVVFWAAVVSWGFRAPRRRIRSPFVVALVTLLGVVPIIGPLIYMLFRPPEYLSDVRERELEIRAIERRLQAQECPV